MTDLDDRTRCPIGGECATCQGADGLRVVTVQTPVGVFCCTLCVTCVEDGERLPVLGWATAIEWSMRHCQHLGIDADEMGRLMLAEEMRKCR